MCPNVQNNISDRNGLNLDTIKTEMKIETARGRESSMGGLKMSGGGKPVGLALDTTFMFWPTSG